MSQMTKEEAIATRTKVKDRKAENNVLAEEELTAKHIKEAEKEADKTQAKAEKAVKAMPKNEQPYGDDERANRYYKSNKQY